MPNYPHSVDALRTIRETTYNAPRKSDALRTPSGIYDQAASLRQPVDANGYNPMNKQPTQTRPFATAWSPQQNVSNHQFGATPTMNTQPWNPLGDDWLAYLQGGGGVDQVVMPDYQGATGGPVLLEEMGEFQAYEHPEMEAWVRSITEQLEYGERDRLEAAREAAAARGMYRSGESVLSEDDVRTETQLAVKDAQVQAMVQQGIFSQEQFMQYNELREQRLLANQQAGQAWQALEQQSNQFRASLEAEIDARNQQAQIEMSGMATQYASVLSELETRRSIANQQAALTMEQMKVGYNQFLQQIDLERQLSAAQLQFGYDEMNANMALGYAQNERQGLADYYDYLYGQGNLANQMDIAGMQYGNQQPDMGNAVSAYNELYGTGLYDNEQAFNLTRQSFPGLDFSGRSTRDAFGMPTSSGASASWGGQQSTPWWQMSPLGWGLQQSGLR